MSCDELFYLPMPCYLGYSQPAVVQSQPHLPDSDNMTLFEVPDIKGYRPYEVRALVRTVASKPVEVREAILTQIVGPTCDCSEEAAAKVKQLLNATLHVQRAAVRQRTNETCTN